jgi:hypothetical protein
LITNAKPKIWQSIAGLASAATLVLAISLVNVEPISAPDAQQLALVNNKQVELLWVLEIGTDTIDIQATNTNHTN